MRIRRFEAPDSKTALAMVKAELGEDAVILANRSVPAVGGRARKYGRTMVEVVAATDRELYSMAGYSGAEAEQPAAAVRLGGQGKDFIGSGEVGEAPESVRETALPVGAEQKDTFSVPGAPQPLADPGAGGRWRTRPSSTCGGASNCESKARRPLPVRAEAPGKNPRMRPPAEEVARWREQLIGQIRYDSVLDLERGGRRIVALVGATGVGKTTTVAKIAAHARLHKGLKVALVSMDCYRIGATDQLRTYARIMRIPCEVVLKEKDLPGVIARHRDCDLIIIDTAGKSPYDRGHVGELTRWFAGVPGIEPHLTVSATTKKEDLRAVFGIYREMEVAGLILTKLDETRAYATLCQQLAAAQIPVSCFCVGQRVPEDLVPVGKEAAGVLFREGWQAFRQWCSKQPSLSMPSRAAV